MSSDKTTGDDIPVRLIKKYPNRRIYDTHESRYIRLEDLRGMVMQGIPFRVVDSRSGDDITRGILLQIIAEQEVAGDQEPLFSADHLRDFIRYGQEQQQMFSDFMTQSLAFFHHQQEQFSENMQDMFGQNPMKAFADITRSNMEMWQAMQENFYGRKDSKDGQKNPEDDGE